MPIISMVMPTYNQAHFLPRALDSIFNQTFINFEFIVVNDGSTDETANILSEYSKKFPFHIINQSNQGLPEALNTGFHKANGRFFTWTSSDNILLPTMLEKLYQVLQNHPLYDIVYGDWFFIDETGNVLSEFFTFDYNRQLLLQFNLVHCCFLFRRQVFEKIGGYNPNFIYSEDWEFWIRASRHFRMKHIPETLYQYRIHPKSMTSELLGKKAHQKIDYPQFANLLRRNYPVDWYLGKIKKLIIKIKLGYDPLDKWLR
jgi:glycosyltransferase involved in cell wall biosynthesis